MLKETLRMHYYLCKNSHWKWKLYTYSTEKLNFQQDLHLISWTKDSAPAIELTSLPWQQLSLLTFHSNSAAHQRSLSSTSDADMGKILEVEMGSPLSTIHWSSFLSFFTSILFTCKFLPGLALLACWCGFLFSERSLYAVARPSSVCNARASTQPGEIVSNVSTPFGRPTLAIRWHPQKILRRSSQGSPSIVEVKRKTGSQI